MVADRFHTYSLRLAGVNSSMFVLFNCELHSFLGVPKVLLLYFSVLFVFLSPGLLSGRIPIPLRLIDFFQRRLLNFFLNQRVRVV